MTIDLTTNYGGLQLKSPIVVGACPLTADEHTRVAIQTAGAAAIVLPSLFEEHVLRWSRKLGRVLTKREQAKLANPIKNQADFLGTDAETYLATVNRASSQLSIPIIASLNGYATGGWIDFAGELQEAGAAGIELSIHHPPPREYSGPREVEKTVVGLIREVNAAITIPLYVKLERNYTSMPHLARELLSGVSGMVLHGRSPDVDVCLDTLKLKMDWGLTSSGSIIQSLNRIMQVHSFCPAMPLAASGGIGSPSDVAKSLLAGADVAMVTSAVYRDGPDAIRGLADGLREFMNQHRLKSMRELQMQRPLEFATKEERATYMAALSMRLDASQTHRDKSEIHGDRYGHSATLHD